MIKQNFVKSKVWRPDPIIVFSIFFIFAGCTVESKSKTEKISSTTGIEIENLAVDFSLQDLEGKKYSIKDYKGKVVLLNFWATWCPYCTEEIPQLKKLYDQYNKSGLVILSLNIQENQTKVKKFIDKKKIEYKVLLDLNAEIAQTYKVVGIPTNVLIDKKGIIKFKGNILPDEQTIKSILGKKS